MNEIKCPSCGKMFKIDEKDYESIAIQIRNHEFEEELRKREKEFEKEKNSELELLEKDLNIKNSSSLVDKDKEIEKLKNDLEKKEMQHKLELKEAIQTKVDEINKLNNNLVLNEKEYQLKEQSLKENYESKLKNKDEEIELYKDMKLRLSTKMVGETLEQHCKIEFEKYLRSALPKAYFEKDNDSSSGSKGDFIFRDYSDDGIEYISIMFEMKNEADTTATKHKNEDFLKELDKDRKEKNCEYAVLVSLLEKDNEAYNTGIVDVSHKYPKMYVIRPQFFIPIINILRNASAKTIETQRELIEIQNKNIDISNFEENMNNFKEAFGKNYKIASDRFRTAIEEIDKSIEHLEKIKKNLLSSENNLRLANNKVEDLSIKRLTANAPSIAEKFEELGVDVNKKRIKNKKNNDNI